MEQPGPKKLKLEVTAEEASVVLDGEWNGEEFNGNSTENAEDPAASSNQEQEEDEELSFSDFDCEVVSNSSASESDKKFTYQVLTPDSVLENINELIHSVSGLIQLPPSTTCSLLQRFHWQQDALTDTYYSSDNSNSSDLLKLLGIQAQDQALAPNAVLNCHICTEEFGPNDEDVVTGMCQHHFCNACWCGYLKSKVSEGSGLQIFCPAPKCPLLLSYTRVKEFIEANLSQEILQKYFHHVANDIVSTFSNLTWCLSPKSCTNAIKVDSVVSSRRVDCSCGYCFCFGCQKGWHDPLKCEFLESWTKLCNEEALNAEWFMKNTKKCPRCHVAIQKNGGCNIMFCRNPSCRTEFCWACLQDGVSHGTPHACSLWPTDRQDARMGEDASSNRLVACRDKYMGQKTSSKAEEKLIPKVEAAMARYETEERRSWVEVTFLKKSLASLKECRQLLMYSCGFAYYLDIDPDKSDNNVMLFDRSFQEFEHAVEGLSWIFENQLDLEFGLVKKNLDIKVTNCNKRRLALLEHVYEGYEKGWWKFAGGPGSQN